MDTKCKQPCRGIVSRGKLIQQEITEGEAKRQQAKEWLVYLSGADIAEEVAKRLKLQDDNYGVRVD